jgi:3-oxoacyl-[acyl-carrier protein] reductase
MIAVVTGASRGIGRATAVAFAKRGVRVALLGRDCLAAAQEIGGHAFACNVADSISVNGAAKQVLDQLGVPDVVVNNAGVVERVAIEAMTDDEWDHVLDVNLKGTFLVTRAFLPAMRVRGSGRIIHLGSISSTLGTPRHSAYCASKWGVVGFMKSLAEELRGSGLQTMALLPGSVDTDMLAGSGFPPQMSADDVARELVHLSLDASAALHGSAIEMFG